MNILSFISNCPINERTGDGMPVGRCWIYLPDGKTCSRHGDVSAAVEFYKKSGGKLTLERESNNHNHVQRAIAGED